MLESPRKLLGDEARGNERKSGRPIAANRPTHDADVPKFWNYFERKLGSIPKIGRVWDDLTVDPTANAIAHVAFFGREKLIDEIVVRRRRTRRQAELGE